MNPLIVLFFISLILDDFFFKQGKFLKYYLSSIIAYTLFYIYIGGSKLNTPYRKLLIAGFPQSYDSVVYGVIKPDVSKVKDYIEKYYQKTGKKLSITLFFSKLMGRVISEFPTFNNAIKFGKHTDRGSTDVCVLIDVKGSNLGYLTLRNVDKKNLGQLNDEFTPTATAVREEKDNDIKKSNEMVKNLPSL